MSRLLLWCTAILAGGVLPAGAEPVTEWQVPWREGRPRDPYPDPAGYVWFCGQGGGYLGRLDPRSGAFERFALHDEPGPHNLIVDGAGAVWFAGNTTGHIGRFDPATGVITRHALPDPAARDPHTLIWDGAGNIWFTVQHGNFIGRLDPARGETRLVALETPHARPYGIAVDAGNRPWAALFGTNRIATVDPQSFTLREIALPRADARPRRLAVTTNGDVWYGDYAGGVLGRYRPMDSSFREWPLPGGSGAWPYAVAVDGSDRVWLAETGITPNRLVAFDTKTERFVASVAVPSGGGVIRHMVYHAPTKALWFGADTGTIGRARVP
jgi:virginiamycin B lyase